MASLRYSLVVPYFRTPEITRMCLHSIYHFAHGEPEVIVIDNDPSDPGAAMLDEYPQIRRIDNPTATRGSLANFEALDIGLDQASHDLVGILHSDTIFLQPGWDLRWFGHLQQQQLGAISTLEREANPFRPWRKRIEDWFHHVAHRRQLPAGKDGKLMLYFLLTRRSLLADMGYRFSDQGNITVDHYRRAGQRVELLSLVEGSRFMWHTSNVTSLLTGQMDDPVLMAKFADKRRRLLASPLIREHFADVLPSFDDTGPGN